MNAMTACADACSNSTGIVLGAFADAQMRIACIVLWLLFVAVNVALASYVWRGRRNICGCESCCLRAVGRPMLAAACNMALPFVGYFFVPEQSFSAQRDVVGGNPGANNAPMSMLFTLFVMALVAVFAYCSVAAKTPLSPYRRYDGECRRESARQQDEVSADTIADTMALLEDQLLSPGVSWERELSVALAKK